jgi:magnesium chelatase family protein
MPFATTRTITLQGSVGHLIDVEVDVSQGVVATSLVGRPDAAINEARDRCRLAVQHSGLTWPTTRRLTISLSPADLPKRGPHFDLAIAVGVVVASGQLGKLRSERDLAEELESAAFIGELTLAGRLRCVPGVLPMVMAAASRGVKRVFVPEPQAPEAMLVPGVEVMGVRSLSQVVAELCQLAPPDAPPVAAGTTGALVSWRGEDRLADADLADLIGMADARYALEVAAAGGHHLLLTGPKGAGKTSLAERLPGILPDLTVEESLELTAIHSLAGVLDEGGGLVSRPPFAAPHHTSTRASLLGGGTGRVRPGEISRAHCGVLFLDEFPLFNVDILEALRQPLESGEVTIARGDETATYPARGMVVLACNPCPCGGFANDVNLSDCRCGEVPRRDYRRKLEGPVIDRIDITRQVQPVGRHEAEDPFAVREGTATVRRRVQAARQLQAERYAGHGWRVNGQVPGPRLRDTWPLAVEAMAELDRQVFGGALTRRGATRVHRLAWTVADLAGVGQPGVPELTVALDLRLGRPLQLACLRSAG